MKFIFASDSFKGTLSTKEISDILSQTCHTLFPYAECISVPLADGGEGTMECLHQIVGGTFVTIQAHDAKMRDIHARYLLLDEKTAVTEVAETAGLPQLKVEERDPRYTSSYGLGECIRSAVENGCRTIYIALGGSSTNDGGIGALQAMGVRFLDAENHEVIGIGDSLGRISSFELTEDFEIYQNVKFVILSDVTNPLCGKDGAAYTFGKQKGGTPEILDSLENGMQNFERILSDSFQTDVSAIAGGGAAGGLGASMKVFLHASMQSGVETVLSLARFEELIKDADYIITGEGMTDWQSANGKAVCGVGEFGKKSHVPVIDLCGAKGEGADLVKEHGVTWIIAATPSTISFDEVKKHAAEYYCEKAYEIFKALKDGIDINMVKSY